MAQPVGSEDDVITLAAQTALDFKPFIINEIERGFPPLTPLFGGLRIQP